MILPILSLTYLESAGEFRRAQWSQPAEQVALPVLASVEDARRGPGKLLAEASGVHATPLAVAAGAVRRPCGAEESRMSGPVFVEQEPNQGTEVPVEPGATIGREGCDITLSDPDVSRRHAAIQIVRDEVSIEDLGSTNGTFVNGQRIEERRRLSDGDEIQIGSTVWRLRAPASATRLVDQAEPAPPD